MTTNTWLLLEGTATSVVRWVSSESSISEEEVNDFIARPSYTSAQRLMNAVDRVVHVYTNALSVTHTSLAAVIGPALHTELPAIWAGGWVNNSASARDGIVVGLAAKLREMVADLGASSRSRVHVVVRELQPLTRGGGLPTVSPFIRLLAIASVDLLTREEGQSRYNLRLAQVQTTLGLRSAELARLLGVSSEAIRRWFAGASVAPDRWTDIDRLDRIVRRLTTYFTIDALPAIIRRPIPGLGNKSALELLNAGREEELLDFYDGVYSRGVTQ